MPRPRSEPPAKFAFLSGIHPDLDEALCEVDCNALSYHGQTNRPRSRRSNAYNAVKRNMNTTSLSSSQEYYPEEIPEQQYHHHGNERSSISSGTSYNTYQNTRIESSKGITPSSRPIEITCNMDESVESLPFSVDGMEKAKRKIKSQAARIRDLEEKLQRNISIENSMYNASAKENSTRKILSPEERLKAHKERKKLENKYKEEKGKWASPAPSLTKRQSISKKVKRRDDFVERLAADPKERKRYDEVKRRITRSMRKLHDGTIDHDENDSRNSSSSPLVRRQSQEEELFSMSSTAKKIEHPRRGRKGRESLMKRLNMGVEERRDSERNNILRAARRASSSRQHAKTSASNIRENSKQNFFRDDGAAGSDTIHRRRLSESKIQDIRCQTCGSTRDCEEDKDDPNIYYCSLCWEEYENSSNLDMAFQEEFVDNESNEDCGSDLEPSLSRDYDRALWIVHDNPKLASRLVCSGPNKMPCLVETKDPRIKNCVRIMHGIIDYSGPVVHSGGRNMRNVNETDRGAECIRLSNMWGFVIHHEKVEARLSKNQSVYEFQLDKSDGLQLTGPSAQMTAKDFFKDCVGAVDVILDPQCSPGGWYPIREANGSRKIAPQFRSKGIGYIRLGDDMGQNGQAFMSNDCCKTFLFNESVEREELNSDLMKTVSSFSSKPSFRSSRSQSNHSHAQSYKRRQRDSRSETTATKSGVYEVLSEEDDCSSISSRSSETDRLNAGEVLKDLQNMEGLKDMKWKEKADLLIKLGKAVSKPEGRSWCEGALNYIQDIISAKNVNIHVLRSALVVVDKVGHVLGDELPHHVAWRTIMIEILKMLKNKQCGGGAREILQKLHGKCYTLSKSLTSISHVLGITKTLSTSQRKISVKKSSSNSMQQQQGVVKANNVEVIEWLAVTTEAERFLEEIDPAMDESDLQLLTTFFLSHESHRDARCRKNALDGLLHTMLYGVEVLDMSVQEVQSLCSELKTTKPKSWARLIKSLNMVLKS